MMTPPSEKPPTVAVEGLGPRKKAAPRKGGLLSLCLLPRRRPEARKLVLLPVAPVTMGYETISQSSSGQLSRLPSESSTWTVSPSMVQP